MPRTLPVLKSQNPLESLDPKLMGGCAGGGLGTATPTTRDAHCFSFMTVETAP